MVVGRGFVLSHEQIVARVLKSKCLLVLLSMCALLRKDNHLFFFSLGEAWKNPYDKKIQQYLSHCCAEKMVFFFWIFLFFPPFWQGESDKGRRKGAAGTGDFDSCCLCGSGKGFSFNYIVRIQNLFLIESKQFEYGTFSYLNVSLVQLLIKTTTIQYFVVCKSCFRIHSRFLSGQRDLYVVQIILFHQFSGYYCILGQNILKCQIRLYMVKSLCNINILSKN